MADQPPVRIRVTRDIQGRWHDDTWYRVGQEFDAVPTVPPYTPGWQPLGLDHSGTVAAEDAEVIAGGNQITEALPPAAAEVLLFEVAKLDLQPGDTLVIRCGYQEEAQRAVGKALGAWYPDNKIIFMGREDGISVLRPIPTSPPAEVGG